MDRNEISTKFDAIATEYNHQPYGPSTSARGGLTPRGKVAVVIGGMTLAVASVGVWQYHTAAEAEADIARQRLALEERKLAAAEEARRAEAVKAAQPTDAQRKARDRAVQTCVDKGAKGPGFVNTADLVDKCSAAFPADTAVNTAAAGASTSTGDGDDGGGAGIGGTGLLVVGLGAVALLAGKSKRRA